MGLDKQRNGGEEEISNAEGAGERERERIVGGLSYVSEVCLDCMQAKSVSTVRERSLSRPYVSIVCLNHMQAQLRR